MRRFSTARAAKLLCFLLWGWAVGVLPTIASDTLRVTLTGDILLDRGVRIKIEKDGVDALFSRSVDSVFALSDVVVGNLECPVTTIKEPVQKLYIFRGEPEWLPALKAHGMTHLNLANNHSIDQGRRGLLDTREQVIRAGMVPFGAGRNMAEASEPVLLGTSPRPVYLFGALRLPLENFAYLPDLPCVSQESRAVMLERIRTLRSECPDAYIMVSLHWGGEHQLEPVIDQVVEAHALIDAGADILVCHHSHTLQRIEIYKGKYIFYSIGNFIFDQQAPVNSRACMVTVSVTAGGAHVETLPIVISDCVPDIVGE